MRTFNFDLMALTATVVIQFMDMARAQDSEPASATITILAPDSSFLFDNVNDGTLVYTDVTQKGVAISGQTTYAALAVGAAEYVTTEPILNKVATATTTFTWSVGIVADVSHAEYEISETDGAQLLDLQCTYSDGVSGACSNVVRQGDGNFVGDVTGRPREATFTPIILTVSASTSTSTPTPSANALLPPQGQAVQNTTRSVAISQSTFNQTSQTRAALIPTSTTSAAAAFKSFMGQNIMKYWMVFLFAVAVQACGA
ncbi:hypothetical protein BJ912DRAFT_113762 [Pholiota molesta]|nr:hypothetical protein BJ912DRAFT_113762 [Pholiota molesta]